MIIFEFNDDYFVDTCSNVDASPSLCYAIVVKKEDIITVTSDVSYQGHKCPNEGAAPPVVMLAKQ